MTQHVDLLKLVDALSKLDPVKLGMLLHSSDGGAEVVEVDNKRDVSFTHEVGEGEVESSAVVAGDVTTDVIACGESEGEKNKRATSKLPVQSAISETSSWADQVEQELSSGDSSVSGLERVSRRVRSSVVFGGFGSVSDESSVAGAGGSMSAHVRTEATAFYRSELKRIGVRLPRTAGWHLAMITHTAGTMPSFFVNGKNKLNTMAVCGDAALVLAVASAAVSAGRTAESVQKLRSTVLTDAEMQVRFDESSFSKYVSVVSGVSLRYSKTGATALEALVGLVAFYCTPADVNKLARYFKFI